MSNLKAYEAKLAGRLLEMASEQFSNHGCNDVEPSLYEGVDVTQRRQLEADFNAYNCPSGDADQYVLLAHIGDASLMSYFAAKLLDEEDEA